MMATTEAIVAEAEAKAGAEIGARVETAHRERI